MKLIVFTAAVLVAGLTGCGPSGTVTEETEKPVYRPDTKESFYEKGHAMYAEARYDSAAHYLEKARELDPTYLPPLQELGEIYYLGALSENGGDGGREARMRKAFECYSAIESLGRADENTYDRLTELSHGLGDTKSFVLYAEKQAARNPGDRVLYNLGLAYFSAEAYQKVIDTQKEAIQKYPLSPYLGGFYRLLGDGYLNVDRQQSAERTYEEGVRKIDERISVMKGTNTDFAVTQEYRQLADSRQSMLLSLKKLYRLHGKQDKLEQVESRLKKDP